MDLDFMHLEEYNLHFPGHRIGGENRDAAFEVLILLSFISDLYCEAVVSASQFRPMLPFKRRMRRDRTNKKAIHNSIYAKSFVSTLHGIRKILGQFPEVMLTEEFNNIRSEYQREFKDYTPIRDSFSHLEDRARGLDRNGEQIKASVLPFGGWIFPDKYTYIGSDGFHYTAVINMETVRKAQDLLQRIINCFSWE